jgi:tetratricopeptide (TPR) repeat protein
MLGVRNEELRPMGIVGRLFQDLTTAVTGKRRWTPQEVRDLVQRGDLQQAAEAVKLLAEGTPDRELTGLCLGGEIAFREHRDADAESMFREALSISPGRGDAHYGLSLVFLARGEKEPALRHAQFSVNASKEARCSAQLGLCQLEMGNHKLAESALARATRLDPLDKASWNNLGITRRVGGRIGGAKAAFERALEIDPHFAQAAANAARLASELKAAGVQVCATGEAQPDAGDGGTPPELLECRRLAEQGELDLAINQCEEFCQRFPDDGRYAIDLSRFYRANGDPQSGLDVLQAYLSRHSDDLDIVTELACALAREGEYKQAFPLAKRALESRPDDVRALNCMAELRIEQSRFAKAGELLEKAFAIEPSIEARGRLAANLLNRCHYERALEHVQKMLEERPSVAGDVAGIQIYALTNLGRHDEALPLVERAIQENPHDPNRRFPRATIHLLNERFAQGWDDYAYRNLASTKHLRMLPFPQWAGEPLEGKTILLLADQGLGDQVMFASCLPDLLALRPGRTVVEVNARVAKTIARSFPTCEVIPTKQDNAFEWVPELGQIDYFAPIGDLPQRFRRERSDFPDHRGYLQPDPIRTAYWREQLFALGPKPKIGVSWRGGSEVTRRVLRTMDVTQLLPLTQACDADWVCLQYGDVTEDLAKARDGGLNLRYWPESIKDLDEFSALISALDLVVTVCNTTVHYAGALARPVWVMAPRIPEWRYGLHSTVMPWYPTSTMFRQAVDGDWASTLDVVARRLLTRRWLTQGVK